MKDFTIVFVHGVGGHDADWFPSIAKELEVRNIPFRIPAFSIQAPIPVDEWLGRLHDVVGEIDTGVIFVGYSLGTRTILLYLEKYKLQVKHVFLVAALSNDTKNALREDGRYASFFTHRVNTELIKRNVGNITIFHSKDDEFVPYEQGVELSEELAAELLTYEDRGHFIEPEYVKDILLVLEEKLGI